MIRVEDEGIFIKTINSSSEDDMEGSEGRKHLDAGQRDGDDEMLSVLESLPGSGSEGELADIKELNQNIQD